MPFSLLSCFQAKTSNPGRATNSNRKLSAQSCLSTSTTLIPQPEIAALDITHHVLYGQPGSPTATRTLPTSWKSLKQFKNPSRIWSWGGNGELSKGQVERIILGFRPQEMEDKWVVYAVEGEQAMGEVEVRVHFHRSWTGSKLLEIIMIAKILSQRGGEKEYGAGKITGLIWDKRQECSKEETKQMAKEWQRTVREVCRWVLGVEVLDR